MKARAKKSLGQNFLVDGNAIARIVSEIPPDCPLVLEIGPGRGALSLPLAARVKKFCFIEKDEELYESLLRELDGAGVQGYYGWAQDALDFNFNKIWDAFGKDQDLIVAANLPYNVATEILFRLMDNAARIPLMILMFQKEVAERLAARPGSKKFGTISVFVQNVYDTDTVISLKPDAFRPRPKVDSAVVRLERRSEPLLRLQPEEMQPFRFLVQSLFRFRRKTLENALKFALHSGEADRATNAILKTWRENAAECWQRAGIKCSRRAETLTVQEWGLLFRALGGNP